MAECRSLGRVSQSWQSVAVLAMCGGLCGVSQSLRSVANMTECRNHFRVKQLVLIVAVLTECGSNENNVAFESEFEKVFPKNDTCGQILQSSLAALLYYSLCKICKHTTFWDNLFGTTFLGQTCLQDFFACLFEKVVPKKVVPKIGTCLQILQSSSI